MCSVLLVLFLATGCYFQSKHALDKASIPRDKQLIGKWKPSKYSKDFYDIKAGKGKFMYAIDHHKYDSKKKVVLLKVKYVGYLSKVKNYTFMNVKKVWELDYKGNGRTIAPGNQKYIFLRINKKGSGFTGDIVTNNIREKFNSSNAQKQFFTKYSDLSFFYHKQTAKFLKK